MHRPARSCLAAYNTCRPSSTHCVRRYRCLNAVVYAVIVKVTSFANMMRRSSRHVGTHGQNLLQSIACTTSISCTPPHGKSICRCPSQKTLFVKIDGKKCFHRAAVYILQYGVLSATGFQQILFELVCAAGNASKNATKGRHLHNNRIYSTATIHRTHYVLEGR